MIKPVPVEAFAQAHARPVQQHPDVRRGQRQVPADFIRFKFQPLAHHEYPRARRGQRVQAALQHPEEILLFQRAARIAPCLRLLDQMAVGMEQRVDGIVVRLAFGGLDLALAAAGAQTVDDLELEDAGDVRAQCRPARKAIGLFQRGDQRILHGILGKCLISKLQLGEPDQHWPHQLQLAVKRVGSIHCAAVVRLREGGARWCAFMKIAL